MKTYVGTCCVCGSDVEMNKQIEVITEGNTSIVCNDVCYTKYVGTTLIEVAYSSIRGALYVYGPDNQLLFTIMEDVEGIDFSGYTEEQRAAYVEEHYWDVLIGLIGV